MPTLTLALLLLCGAPPAAAQEQPSVPPAFDQVFLVLLMAGDRATEHTPEQLAELQKQHLTHLHQLTMANKIVVAGPFKEPWDPRLRGMCLYKTETIEEARQLAEQDPAVQAGRLKVEVVQWWYEKGRLAFPMAAAQAATGARGTKQRPR